MLIIIAIIIVIYYLLRHKPIMDILKQVWLSKQCIIASLLGFEVIRNIFQIRWDHRHSFITYSLQKISWGTHTLLCYAFLESKNNREQISVVRCILLLCASAASWSGRGQIPMSMAQCVLFRLTSHESWDHWGSLVSSLEQVHTKTRSLDTLKPPTRICIGTELKWWRHWFLKIIHETLFSTLFWLYVLHWYLR